jgi:hypothetical protein
MRIPRIDPSLAWNTTLVFFVCIGLISLIAFVGTLKPVYAIPAAFLCIVAWIVLYKLIEGIRARMIARALQRNL